MERKVNTEFEVTWKGKQIKLKVIEEESCAGCFFACKQSEDVPCKTGTCFSEGRKDKISVIFKEAKV
jgi:hypothetical protein